MYSPLLIFNEYKGYKVVDFFLTMNWAAVGQIIMIDLLLGGDNAIIIALACRNLPHNQRKIGILWGTAGAIILRIILIFFVLSLLNVPFLKVIAGGLLLWIGVKMLLPNEHDVNSVEGGSSIWSAVKTIIIADFVMSLDNVMAISGAAEGAAAEHQMGLVIFGLLLSIPIIIFGSTLILKLIDRFPIVVLFGAGLLGWIAVGLMITDVFVIQYFPSFAHGAELTSNIPLILKGIGALFVVVTGHFCAKRVRKSQQALIKEV